MPAAQSAERCRISYYNQFEAIKNLIPHNPHMTNMTLYIVDEQYKRMKSYKELKWSEIIREAIAKKLKELEEADCRTYAVKRLGEGEDADELFEF